MTILSMYGKQTSSFIKLLEKFSLSKKIKVANVDNY